MSDPRPVSRSVPDTGRPPSHPDVRRSRPESHDPTALSEHAQRLQMLIALLLGAVLVSASLYVWRRPKVESVTIAATESSAPSAMLAMSAAAAEPLVLIGDPRVIGCQDPGPGKTEVSACGAATPLAAALKKAIADNEACLPTSEGAATLEFVADFQFTKRRLTVTAPQSSRTVKSSRAAIACATAVKRSLLAAGALNLEHEHARMKLSAQASYAAR